MEGNVSAPLPSTWWKSSLQAHPEHDFPCPRFDALRKEPGCQVRCGDVRCSSALSALSQIRNQTPSAHIVSTSCKRDAQTIVTIKGGEEVLRTEDCPQLSNSLFSRHELHRRHMLYAPIHCVTDQSLVLPPLYRMRSHISLCESPHGAVHQVAHFMHATNIVIDINHSHCRGQSRNFESGFLTLPCMLGPASPQMMSRFMRHIFSSYVPSTDNDVDAVQAPEEFTVFVTRTDMGNFFHHMPAIVGVFEVFDYVKPPSATIVMLDVRLQCWGKINRGCLPDCFGRFKEFRYAVAGDSQVKVVGLQEWANGRPVRVREAVFSTEGSHAVSSAWGELRPCFKSSVMRAFQAQIFAYYRVSNHMQPTQRDLVQLLWNVRRKLSTNKPRMRSLVNEDELLTAVAEEYRGVVNLTVVDFATLSLRGQIEVTSRSNVFTGYHGAGFSNVMWLRQRSVVVEILPIGYDASFFCNVARLLGGTFLEWVNPYPDMQEGFHLHIAWPTIKPTFDVAIDTARYRSPPLNFSKVPYLGPPPTDHRGWSDAITTKADEPTRNVTKDRR